MHYVLQKNTQVSRHDIIYVVFSDVAWSRSASSNPNARRAIDAFGTSLCNHARLRSLRERLRHDVMNHIKKMQTLYISLSRRYVYKQRELSKHLAGSRLRIIVFHCIFLPSCHFDKVYRPERFQLVSICHKLLNGSSLLKLI